MRFSTVKYYIGSAIESLFKNGLMSFASIITVASCIFIFIVSFCIAGNIDYFLEQMESKIGFTVYLTDDVTDAQREAFQEKIQALPYVTKVDYISKQSALESMKKENSENASIYEGLEKDNPLPASLEVYLENTKYQDEVLLKIKQLDEINNYIENVSSRDTKGLLHLNNIVRFVSLIIFLAMGAISILLIMITINLTVNNRKREINIMKYVGATDWFIRWPFIIEGILIGMIGSIIPVCLSFYVYSKMIPLASGNSILRILGELIHPATLFLFLGPVSVGLGVIIGVIGSSVSIRRHLKV